MAVLDPVTLSALLSSRLCHDLINPIGALSTGLEVMRDDPDPEMHAEAVRLIQLSTDKSIAMLSFARLAFGFGGGAGHAIGTDEIKKISNNFYQFVKAELDWQLPDGAVSKTHCKAIMSILIMIADCAPRKNSKISVLGHSGAIIFKAEGPKACLKDTMRCAFEGGVEGLEPKMTPAYLAFVLAQEAGGTLDILEETQTCVTMRLVWPQEAAYDPKTDSESDGQGQTPKAVSTAA